MIVAEAKSGQSHYRRFEDEELAHVAKWWHRTLADALNEFSVVCFDPLFEGDFP